MRFVYILIFCLPLFASAAVTVTDDLGNEVTLPAPAKRIVSLTPHLTEMLFRLGVGDQIVGTARYSNYPDAARTIPRVGDAFSVNIESVLGMEPDIVFAWHTGGANKAINKLRDFGIPVFVSESESLKSIGDNLSKMGLLVGAPDAELLKAEFLEQLDALRQSYANPPTVFFQISDQELYSVSNRHLIGQALTHCGAINVFSALSPDVSMVSEEAVIAAAPDIILMTQIPDGETSLWAGRWNEFDLLKDKVYTIDPNLVSQPGVRFLEGIADICKVVDTVAQRLE